MIKDEIPRGQLSNIILSTLFDNDKYGYEIIDVVKEKTDGKVIIKQPTLYSSLRRMEEQGLISSYWRDSEIGGRRHYYSITDYGKKYAEKWRTDLNDFLSSLKDLPTNNKIEANKQIDNLNKTGTVLQQTSLVDITKNETQKDDTKEASSNKVFVQYDLFTSPTLISEPSDELFDRVKKLREEADDENIERDVDKIDMLSSLRNSHQSAQEDITTNYVAKSYNVNKKADIKTAFLNLTKNNKSFATAIRDNDVMTFENKQNRNEQNNELKFNEEEIKTNDTNQKDVINNTKENHSTDIEEDVEKNSAFNRNIYQSTNFDNNDSSFVDLNTIDIKESNNQQPLYEQNLSESTIANTPSPNLQEQDTFSSLNEGNKKDDAVVITNTPDPNNVPRVRKITSERFEQITKNYTSFLDEKLKKQKQDEIMLESEKPNLEHKFENTNYEESQQNLVIKNLYDLDRYYKKNNLKFNTYSNSGKTNMKRYVKINWLNCVSFSIITVISIIISIVMFCILRTAQPSWNFIYIIIPLIFILINIIYIYKYYKSKNAITLTSNVLGYNWIYQLTLCIVTILVLCSVNVLGGLTIDNIYEYSTTLFYTGVITVLYPLWSLVNYVIIKSSTYKNRKS